MDLSNAKIVLGVTGSIAAYKAVYLGRELLKIGVELRVAMTEKGTKFVTPLTFRSALSSPVIVNQFESPTVHNMNHISWARWADLILVAPATANIIAKTASGIADDFLSTLILAADCPVVFIPAMNSTMYLNSLTQKNIKILESNGCYVMTPEYGELASKESGHGRFPEIQSIIDFIGDIIVKKKPLKEKNSS